MAKEVFDVKEKTSMMIRATLTDRDGLTLVPGSSLSTLTLTLYDRATGTILNNRQQQNVLNLNDVTVYNSLQSDPVTGDTYNLEWDMEIADNGIVTATTKFEMHVALFQSTFGTKGMNHEILISVENLTFVS